LSRSKDCRGYSRSSVQDVERRRKLDRHQRQPANVPANAIVIDPDLADTLYAATDDGVFSTQNGGGSWAPLAGEKSRVNVMTMLFHRTSRTLRAGTLGRGMWDLQTPGEREGIMIPAADTASKRILGDHN